VNGCNEIADTGDFVAATRRVNGGAVNLASRQKYYQAAKQALLTPDPAVPAAPPVPPEGYVKTEDGNLIRADVKQSDIVKGADQAKVVTTVATTATAVGGAASAFAGLDWKVLAVLVGGALGVLVIYLLWRLLQAKQSRIEMNKAGLA
jgi:hypothetical protein